MTQRRRKHIALLGIAIAAIAGGVVLLLLRRPGDRGGRDGPAGEATARLSRPPSPEPPPVEPIDLAEGFASSPKNLARIVRARGQEYLRLREAVIKNIDARQWRPLLERVAEGKEAEWDRKLQAEILLAWAEHHEGYSRMRAELLRGSISVVTSRMDSRLVNFPTLTGKQAAEGMMRYAVGQLTNQPQVPKGDLASLLKEIVWKTHETLSEPPPEVAAAMRRGEINDLDAIFFPIQPFYDVRVGALSLLRYVGAAADSVPLLTDVLSTSESAPAKKASLDVLRNLARAEEEPDAVRVVALDALSAHGNRSDLELIQGVLKSDFGRQRQSRIEGCATALEERLEKAATNADE